MIGICKLCKQEKELIKKSHIFPDFLYKNMFDQNHRIRQITIDIETRDEVVKNPPTGEYEGGLLCANCDNVIIGQYETYVSNLLMCANLKDNEKPELINIVNQEGIEFLECNNVDYKKLKLFLLSLLFRADISSRKTFANVQLGAYNDKIRKMILDGNPSNDKDIGIVILSWNNDNKVTKDYIFQPTRHKINGRTHYVLILLGYLIIFYVSPDNIQKDIEFFRLKINNSLSLIYLPKDNTWDYLLSFTGLKK